MEAYEDFALVYDTFMDETPYDEWCSRILSVLRQAGIEDGLVLDLGCGTGSSCGCNCGCGNDNCNCGSCC